MNIEDRFALSYDFVMSFISDRTALQPLSLEEMIEVCKIASNLLIVNYLRGINDELDEIRLNSC